MLTPSQQRSEKKAADDADAIAAEIGEESTKFVVHAWQMRACILDCHCDQ
jgi:hypothetical protein